MGYDGIFTEKLVNFNKYISRKYVLNDTAYTREGKWTLETAIVYPLCNCKKTKLNDANRYLRLKTGDRLNNITDSGVCDRMQYIDLQVLYRYDMMMLLEKYTVQCQICQILKDV